MSAPVDEAENDHMRNFSRLSVSCMLLQQALQGINFVFTRQDRLIQRAAALHGGIIYSNSSSGSSPHEYSKSLLIYNSTFHPFYTQQPTPFRMQSRRSVDDIRSGIFFMSECYFTKIGMFQVVLEIIGCKKDVAGFQFCSSSWKALWKEPCLI